MTEVLDADNYITRIKVYDAGVGTVEKSIDVFNYPNPFMFPRAMDGVLYYIEMSGDDLVLKSVNLESNDVLEYKLSTKEDEKVRQFSVNNTSVVYVTDSGRLYYGKIGSKEYTCITEKVHSTGLMNNYCVFSSNQLLFYFSLDNPNAINHLKSEDDAFFYLDTFSGYILVLARDSKALTEAKVAVITESGSLESE